MIIPDDDSNIIIEYPNGSKAILGKVTSKNEFGQDYPSEAISGKLFLVNEFAEAFKVIANEFRNNQDPGSVFYVWQSMLSCVIYDMSKCKIDMELCNEMAIKFLKRLAE
ncbi:MAG: hypothetical protein EHM20_00085 [Alphaproteobacteria bacterium]|nr:MAG: hypothetical protein EHM20_00085 [Alphaproteobacteria bacterium]